LINYFQKHNLFLYQFQRTSRFNDNGENSTKTCFNAFFLVSLKILQFLKRFAPLTPTNLVLYQYLKELLFTRNEEKRVLKEYEKSNV